MKKYTKAQIKDREKLAMRILAVVSVGEDKGWSSIFRLIDIKGWEKLGLVGEALEWLKSEGFVKEIYGARDVIKPTKLGLSVLERRLGKIEAEL